MKIDFERILKDLDNKPMKESVPDEDADPLAAKLIPITLSKIAINALMASFQDEQGLSGDDKLKRWLIAAKIKPNNLNADYTVEEVALVKKCIGKAYGPVIVGPAFQMLDQIQ